MTDTIEKIDFEKLKNHTVNIFNKLWDLANRDERPKLN